MLTRLRARSDTARIVREVRKPRRKSFYPRVRRGRARNGVGSLIEELKCSSILDDIAMR